MKLNDLISFSNDDFVVDSDDFGVRLVSKIDETLFIYFTHSDSQNNVLEIEQSQTARCISQTDLSGSFSIDYFIQESNQYQANHLVFLYNNFYYEIIFEKEGYFEFEFIAFHPTEKIRVIFDKDFTIGVSVRIHKNIFDCFNRYDESVNYPVHFIKPVLTEKSIKKSFNFLKFLDLSVDDILVLSENSKISYLGTDNLRLVSPYVDRGIAGDFLLTSKDNFFEVGGLKIADIFKDGGVEIINRRLDFSSETVAYYFKGFFDVPSVKETDQKLYCKRSGKMVLFNNAKDIIFERLYDIISNTGVSYTFFDKKSKAFNKHKFVLSLSGNIEIDRLTIINYLFQGYYLPSLSISSPLSVDRFEKYLFLFIVSPLFIVDLDLRRIKKRDDMIKRAVWIRFGLRIYLNHIHSNKTCFPIIDLSDKAMLKGFILNNELIIGQFNRSDIKKYEAFRDDNWFCIQKNELANNESKNYYIFKRELLMFIKKGSIIPFIEKDIYNPVLSPSKIVFYIYLSRNMNRSVIIEEKTIIEGKVRNLTNKFTIDPDNNRIIINFSLSGYKQSIRRYKLLIINPFNKEYNITSDCEHFIRNNEKTIGIEFTNKISKFNIVFEEK